MTRAALLALVVACGDNVTPSPDGRVDAQLVVDTRPIDAAIDAQLACSSSTVPPCTCGPVTCYTAAQLDCTSTPCTCFDGTTHTECVQ